MPKNKKKDVKDTKDPVKLKVGEVNEKTVNLKCECIGTGE